MDEKQLALATAHKLAVADRRTGSITGVQDVLSFDLNEILLSTSQGMMTIKGTELHVNRLNLDKQEVELEGKIDSITYSDGGAYGPKTGDSLLKRLFK